MTTTGGTDGMCLAKVEEVYEHPSMVIQDGRKDFAGAGTKLKFKNNAYRGKFEVPLDQWIEADHAPLIEDGSFNKRKYLAGFHIYQDEVEAGKKGFTRRVYFRRATARGEQDNLKVVVALEMYVPSDPSAWPPSPNPVAPPTPPTPTPGAGGKLASETAAKKKAAKEPELDSKPESTWERMKRIGRTSSGGNA